MEFIEAPAFTRHLPEYLSDERFKEFQTFLMANPEAGDVIQGTGGFRKSGGQMIGEGRESAEGFA